MDKKKIFMIMPFKEEFFEVYEMLKNEFEERFEFSHAGEEDNQQNILQDIIQPIYEADAIIADLTELNSNVLYELGIAHTFNKKTIIITKDDMIKLPFDLKSYRANNYDTHFKKFNELIKILETLLNGAIDNTINFSNPVKDFLKINNIDNMDWFSEKTNPSVIQNADKGFLDYLADIEEEAQKYTESIENITADMEEMNNGVEKSTSEIERVKNKGGNTTPIFIRNEAKKVAIHISKFDSELRNFNQTMSTSWDNIEFNILGLIEHEIIEKDENREGLINFLKSLKTLQNSIFISKNQINGIKESMHNILGYERSMSQAIKFTEEDLTTYMNNADRICLSIDKIIDKSKFVTGKIDFDENNVETAIF